MDNATNMPVARAELPVQNAELAAGVYAGSGAMMDSTSSGAHLFFWLTLTMFWVLMILCILALFKYVTHDSHPMPAPRRTRSSK